MSDMIDEVDTELDPASPEAQLEALKRKAENLGVKFSPRIGVDALREKVNKALEANDDDLPEDGEDDDEIPDTTVEPQVVAPVSAVPVPRVSKARMIINERERLEKDELKLIRFKISCMNPMKKEWPGEIISVGNDVVGVQKKFIPYGVESEDGFHVCQMIFRQLQKRKFLQVKTRTVQGKIIVDSKYVPEFSIEILPQLTQAELEKLARIQAAAKGE